MIRSSNPKGPAKLITAAENERALSVEPPFDLSSGLSHIERNSVRVSPGLKMLDKVIWYMFIWMEFKYRVHLLNLIMPLK